MAFIRQGGFRIWGLLALLLLLVAGAGGLFFYTAFLRDLPELHSVEDFRPSLASRILDRDGALIGEFYTERRIIAPFDAIPEHTRLSFVAAEDQNFFEHAGIDYVAIVRAAWVDVRAGEIKEGASTITMQLVKQLLLSPERKFRRKIREMILARRIESQFTKDEILYLYLNQIYFGHGAWGIAEAAKSYFGKPVTELSISESALLAGLPQRPSEYSPFASPRAAETRRRSVLKRMLSMEAIDEAAYEIALADVPVLLDGGPNEDFRAAGYFTEEVRRYLFDRLGGGVVLGGGLVVETTLDIGLQRVATEAVARGLVAHDERQGYRGHVRHVNAEEIEAEIEKLAEENDRALHPPGPPQLIYEPHQVAEADATADEAEAAAEGNVQEVADTGSGLEDGTLAGVEAEAEVAATGEEEPEPEPLVLPEDEALIGVVTAVDGKAQMARVAFAPGAEAVVHLADVDWAREPHPKRRPQAVSKITAIFSAGDVARFGVIPDGESKAPYPKVEKKKAGDDEEPETPPQRVALRQEPQVEGALLSIETATGDVMAMVGGRAFSESEFNRSTQARRQPGSSFKPFIYGAALSRGYTPVATIYDRPVVIEDAESGFVWRPRNYGRQFYGPLPMRRALAKSINNATVHLFRDVGVDYVIDYARRMGIQSPLSRDLTLALGSSGVTLLELTTAYSVFPNGGRRVLPRFITRVTDRDGQVLLEDVPLGDTPPPVLKPLADVASGPEKDVARPTALYPDGEILPTDQIISEAQAFLMSDMLKAVVQEGTGRAAKRLGGYLGGKTGTTNDQADAWFMGFSPDVTTGVWVGYDQVRVLGWGETGARAALPIWRDYMEAALKRHPVRDFPTPEHIVFERIDRETGLLADATSQDAYFQPFLEDTAPTEFSGSRTSVTSAQRSLREDSFQ